ncbi:hypothetical protein ABBQ38_014266 [Trebouxia sp. C0009 RCD-2024]
MSGVKTGLSITGLLVFGTTTSLFAKIVYELQGPDRQGNMKFFTKPWAMTTVMFLGMSFCLPWAYWEEHKHKKQAREALSSGNGGVTDPLLYGDSLSATKETAVVRGNSTKDIFMLAIPTFFDLIATVLMNIGLLSVTASVYQMMRGAEMLFAALFSVSFLHRSLNRFHLLGILCCVIGITLVGTSSLLGGEGSSTHDISPQKMLLGMGLIVASQCVQAAQITFEDYFMADLHIEPLKIVGYEGVFGSIAMITVLLPLVSLIKGHDGDGLHENSLDTLHMIFHSRPIAIVLLIDMVALLMYNFSGMCVTGALGAVFRTVLETTRTLFVWLVDLLLWYTPLGFGTLGESWSKYSWIQAAGFGVLVCGTLVYSRGDEVQSKRDHLEYEAHAAEEGQAHPSVLMPGDAAPLPIAGSRSVAASRPMAVRGTPTSFKSTMNIHPLSASVTGGGLMGRSMARSISRSMSRDQH